jgi:hypothetical protein
MRILTAFALTLCFACAAVAQQATNNATQLDTKVIGNVNSKVSAQAVLIPRVNARRIFGDEIANNYAVVEVNISNKSPDAALIIHGIFIDYSNWPLSGVSKNDLLDLDKPDGPFADYQGTTRPSQVASEEYRVVRGQLLDAQMWTKRNLVIRALTLAGSLASAYTFALNEQGIIKGITQATGVGIPGIATAWPDSTIEQLNRVSDFGYRANRIVPREGAEVIVCFFPIDRFLTPGFRKLFLKSPALFFAPLQMLVDKQSQGDVIAALGDLGLKASDFGSDVSEKEMIAKLKDKLPCYLQIDREREPRAGASTRPQTTRDLISKEATRKCLTQFGMMETETGTGADRSITVKDENLFKAFMALDYIKSVSLNKVGVTVDGVMSVDTTGIAAKADEVVFDEVANCGGPDKQCFWADPAAGGGVRTGTIRGSYLTGGSVVVNEAKTLGFDPVNTISDGSTDQQLHFSFKLTNGITTDTKLHFKVTKPRLGGGAPLESPEREYPVSYAVNAPQISGNPEVSGDTLTINGSGFFPNSLVVKLTSPTDDILRDVPVKTSSVSKLTLDLKDKKTPGCWSAEVEVGQPASASSKVKFAVLPTKTEIKTAKVIAKDKQIEVDGVELIDTSTCHGQPLTFQVVSEDDETVRHDAPLAKKAQGKLRLKLPPEAAEGNWKLQAKLGDDKVGQAIKLER